VQIGFDDRCNYQCAMCRIHSYLHPSEDVIHTMAQEALARLLRDLQAVGTRTVDVSGWGEPLLHPNALAMLRLIRESGIECQLVTNGSLLSPAVCDELLAMRLNRLRVSINSGTDETHHLVTQAPLGERSQIMEMIRYLAHHRAERGGLPELAATIAIHKYNYREILILAKEAVAVGLDNLEFLPLTLNEASRELALDEAEQEEVRRQVMEADAIMGAAGRTTTAASFLENPTETYWTKEVYSRIPCYAGQFFCKINADGDVNPCCPSVRVMGNVVTHSIREVWASPAYRAFRQEGLALPELGRPVAQCNCYNCCHAPSMREYHALLQAGRFEELCG
jgi:MoaA/NifB/PqqE/SkfB family radical SAM enzyme